MNKLIKCFFVIIVFLSIVQVGRIFSLPIAPENAFIYLFILFCLIKLPYVLSRLSSKVILLITLTIIFVIADICLSFIKGTTVSGAYFDLFRNLCKVILLSLVINNKEDVIFAIKFITIVIAVSTLGGLLIHFIGEPFQSLRMFLLNYPTDSFLGKGDRIAGFSAKIPSFAYQITTGTTMAFGIYLAERNVKWILVFSLLLIGIIYTGERAALLMFAVVLIGILMTLEKRKIVSALTAFILLLLLFSLAFFVIDPHKGSVYTVKEQTLFHRETTGSEFVARIYQQTAGLKVFLKNPILGGTEAQYQEEMRSLFKKHKRYPATHNHYINVIMNLGLTGFIILVSFLILLYKLCTDLKKDTNVVPLNYSYLIIWSLIANFGVALFHNHGVFASEKSCWLVIALICGCASAATRKQNKLI